MFASRPGIHHLLMPAHPFAKEHMMPSSQRHQPRTTVQITQRGLYLAKCCRASGIVTAAVGILLFGGLGGSDGTTPIAAKSFLIALMVITVGLIVTVVFDRLHKKGSSR